MTWKEALSISIDQADRLDESPVVVDCNGDQHWFTIFETDKGMAPDLETDSSFFPAFGPAGEPYERARRKLNEV